MNRRYRWRININGFHKKDLDSATFRGWPHIDSRDEEKWEEYTCLTKMKLHLIFVLIFFGAVAGAGIRGNDGNITHISSHPSIDEEADYIVKPAQVDVDPLEVDQGPPDAKHDGFQDDDELHEADQERELSWRRKKGKSYKSKYYHKKRKQKKYYYHDYYDYRKKHKKRKKYKKYYHKKYKPYYRKKKYGYYYYH